MDQNICNTIPQAGYYDSITTINFVYETELPDRNRFVTKTSYTLYLVTEGTGTLCSTQGRHPIARGDLFFTFPSLPFSIDPSPSGLRYCYISFMGIRGGKILEGLGIDGTNCVFSGYEGLTGFWTDALAIATQENLAILSESVLLYTLSVLSTRAGTAEKISQVPDTILQIKKYIDDNYTTLDLSLDKICSIYQYNKKYLSNALKKVLHVGFAEYLRTLRIRHACMLMTEGLSNVKDIALLSGYKDPLYFSKVFKATMHLSPKEYIAKVKPDAAP